MKKLKNITKRVKIFLLQELRKLLDFKLEHQELELTAYNECIINTQNLDSLSKRVGMKLNICMEPNLRNAQALESNTKNLNNALNKYDFFKKSIEKCKGDANDFISTSMAYLCLRSVNIYQYITTELRIENDNEFFIGQK